MRNLAYLASLAGLGGGGRQESWPGAGGLAKGKGITRDDARREIRENFLASPPKTV